MTFRRTAVKETELAGKTIQPGDKVVRVYSSGNRDAEVFEHPECLDLSRDPNPHVGFGGEGRHMCLGKQLAKAMPRSIFREVRTRVPDIHAVGEPELLGTTFIRGVESLNVAFSPEH
jgi:cytochrome P450